MDFGVLLLYGGVLSLVSSRLLFCCFFQVHHQAQELFSRWCDATEFYAEVWGDDGLVGLPPAGQQRAGFGGGQVGPCLSSGVTRPFRTDSLSVVLRAYVSSGIRWKQFWSAVHTLLCWFLCLLGHLIRHVNNNRHATNTFRFALW